MLSSSDRPLCCATPQKKEEDDRKSGRLKQSAGELRVQKGGRSAAAPTLAVFSACRNFRLARSRNPEAARKCRWAQRCAWRRAVQHTSWKMINYVAIRLAHHAPARSSAATELAAAGFA